MEMAQEWIEATWFRDNPARYACHTNTDNLHIHVLVTTRDTGGRSSTFRTSNTKASTRRAPRSTTARSSAAAMTTTAGNAKRPKAGNRTMPRTAKTGGSGKRF